MRTSNPVALGWKYPGVEGITTHGGEITGWPKELPELTQELVDSIEAKHAVEVGAVAIVAECKSRIYAVADIEDQLNGLKRAIRLERKERRGRGLTADEETQVQTLTRLGEWIDEMRAACKTAIAAGTSVDDIVWPTQ